MFKEKERNIQKLATFVVIIAYIGDPILKRAQNGPIKELQHKIKSCFQFVDLGK